MTIATLAHAPTCKGCGQVETPAVREAWFRRTADQAATLPERFALEITWPDIRDGIGCSTHYCPVAGALNRWLFDHGIHTTDVSVNRESAEIVLDWNQPALRYWHDAWSFVSAYDNGRPVEPRMAAFVRMPR